MKLIGLLFFALALLLGQINTLGRGKQSEIKIVKELEEMEEPKPLYTKAMFPAVINTWFFSNATQKGVQFMAFNIQFIN